MANLNDLTDLKKRLDSAKQDAAKAAGALEQAMSRLQKEHGCDSLEEAEAELAKLTKDEQKAKRAFDEAFEKFKAEYGDKI